MTKEIEKLQELIDNHDNIVFFGGAGVSTDSGIPDFRSLNGLYNIKYEYPPETILSKQFFKKFPEEFFKFYRDKMLCDAVKPNAAHLKLAELEEAGKVKAIIRKLQPEAVMFETNYGQIDVDEILNTNRFDFEKSSMPAGWIHEVEEADLDEDDEHDEHHHDEHEHHHEHNEDHDHDHDHEHHDHDDHDEHEHHGHHHHHHGEGETEEYGIGSFVYYRRRPFAKEKFEDWLDEMPKGIIRSKGIIWAAENNNDAYMFEQAGKQINIANAGQWVATAPRRVRAKMMKEDPTLVEDWDEKVGDRMIKVVFIGHDMDKEAIIKSLDDCLAY